MLIELKEDYTSKSGRKTYKSGSVIEVLPWLRKELVDAGKAVDYKLTRKDKKKIKFQSVKSIVRTDKK